VAFHAIAQSVALSAPVQDIGSAAALYVHSSNAAGASMVEQIAGRMAALSAPADALLNGAALLGRQVDWLGARALGRDALTASHRHLLDALGAGVSLDPQLMRLLVQPDPNYDAILRTVDSLRGRFVLPDFGLSFLPTVLRTPRNPDNPLHWIIPALNHEADALSTLVRHLLARCPFDVHARRLVTSVAALRAPLGQNQRQRGLRRAVAQALRIALSKVDQPQLMFLHGDWLTDEAGQLARERPLELPMPEFWLWLRDTVWHHAYRQVLGIQSDEQLRRLRLLGERHGVVSVNGTLAVDAIWLTESSARRLAPGWLTPQLPEQEQPKKAPSPTEVVDRLPLACNRCRQTCDFIPRLKEALIAWITAYGFGKPPRYEAIGEMLIHSGDYVRQATRKHGIENWTTLQSLLVEQLRGR
jgi:hypothetical protein